LPAALRDDGREDLLDRLALGCERFELGLLSYVLVGNHYHGLCGSPTPASRRGSTSGLCDLRFRPVDELARDEHGVVTAEAKTVVQRDANG
jgi:hypothetical protein